MGVVYVAEQQVPVKRRVALKVIKPGMDTKEVISRFEAERQALALMDHPNIARVLDAGSTESGRPYFVMELVRGIAITEYCNMNRIGAHERLDLFLHVCNAVQHAHQKGIIHRDLKPSNVLITEHDGTPVVKVIDFGVAKAINQQLTERTVYTRHHQMVGTPMYMSPEQAQLSSLDVDTRSDIYSLGVLLYELLTGTTPFDKAKLRQADFDEIRRIIREEEPTKPSTKIRTHGGEGGPSVSGYRSADAGKLSQLLKGDLDWIVMKALEKDRSRRYSTAQGMANDIMRYRADEPIVARPPSATYQLQKFARRHKIMLYSGAAVLLALLVGTVVSTCLAVLAMKAQEVAREAEAEQRSAARHAADNARKAEQLRRTAEQSAAAEAEASKRALTAAEEEARLRREKQEFLYGSDMNVAIRDWQEGNFHRSEVLLERHVPREGEEDLRKFEWYHLWKLTQPRRESITLSTDFPVTGFDFSPDGKRIAVANSFQVRIWNLETLEIEDTFVSEEGWTSNVQFSDDGTLGMRRVGGVTLIDLMTEDELPITTEGGSQREFCFSPDDQLMATANTSAEIALWDVRNGSLVRTVKSELVATRVRQLEFSPNGKTIACVDQDGLLSFWDPLDQRTVEVLRGENPLPRFRWFDFAPDGKTLALATATQVHFLDVGTKKVRPFSEKMQRVGDLGFSPEGDLLGVLGGSGGSRSRTIQLYNANNGQRVAELASSSQSLTFSPAGDYLAVHSYARGVRLWKLPVESNTSVVQGHKGNIRSVSFSNDGSLLASGGAGGVIIWDTTTWEKNVSIPTENVVMSVDFFENGKSLVFCTTQEIVHWDLEKNVAKGVIGESRGSGWYFWSLGISPDNKTVVSGGGIKELLLWDVGSKSRIDEFVGHQSPIVLVQREVEFLGRRVSSSMWYGIGSASPPIYFASTQARRCSLAPSWTSSLASSPFCCSVVRVACRRAARVCRASSSLRSRSAWIC